MRLMIASKFWSRSTYSKPYPGLIGHVIGDSVLYHSLPWIAHLDTLGVSLCEIIWHRILTATWFHAIRNPALSAPLIHIGIY